MGTVVVKADMTFVKEIHSILSIMYDNLMRSYLICERNFTSLFPFQQILVFFSARARDVFLKSQFNFGDTCLLC